LQIVGVSQAVKALRLAALGRLDIVCLRREGRGCTA
jgi:hypothetical protein